MSTDISTDTSADISTDILTDISRSIYRSSVGRYVYRHIGWVSVDMSTDTRPICQPIHRPTHRSRGAQNTHDPTKFGLNLMSRCSFYENVKWQGETVPKSKFQQEINERWQKVLSITVEDSENTFPLVHWRAVSLSLSYQKISNMSLKSNKEWITDSLIICVFMVIDAGGPSPACE